MTNFQIDLFWEEVSQIQQRHSLFFPISQIKYISLQKKETNTELIFLEGYNLPETMTMEILLAFKLVCDIEFEKISFWYEIILKSLRQSFLICMNY